MLILLLEGKKRRVRVNRLHLEDDAGKLVHEGVQLFAIIIEAARR